MSARIEEVDASPRSADHSRSAAYLHVGHIIISTEPCAITTVVGSCVAMFLFDPVLRVGGGNHYVLPMLGSPGSQSTRYGVVAVAELFRRIRALGCRESDLQAELVGGASIIPASEHIGAESLGMKNVRIARQMLAERGIAVLAENTGGSRGRRVVFRTDSGEVLVRRF